MTTTIIIGGHGKVARLTTQELRKQNTEVTSVIRKQEQASDIEALGATPVIADIAALSTDDLTELVDGYDSIIFSAGAGGGSPENTYAVDRDAAIRTVDAAAKAGVKRFIMVSYMGAGPGHGVAEDDSFFAYAQSKSEADEHLAASNLDYTILRPGLLTTEDAAGSIQVVHDQHFNDYPVARGNVALAIAAVLHDPTTVRQILEFGDGSTPISEALAAATH